MTVVGSFSLPVRRETRRLAKAMATVIRSGDLIVLDGQLGSGKTFFVRALCRALGLDERIRVTSPTFALVHEIDTRPRISHADLYRLNLRRDVLGLGLLERRDEGDLVIAEWGSPWVEELGGDALVVSFRSEPRRVEFCATGPRSRELGEGLLNELSRSFPRRQKRAGPSNS
jgi:tRNA threonylcarbamoyladenosine biosynthesis protein TsaE